MYDEKPTANDRDIDEFLEEFEPLFNTYIDNELPGFIRRKSSMIYFTYENYEFIKAQFKLENQRMIGSKFGESSEFLVLNLKQVVGYKKGIFKSMIMFIEKVCKEKNINLLVSQILNPILSKGLEKNGYTIITEEWGSDTNAVKIFHESDSSNKSKKRSKKKRRSRKI